jgi:Arc/MetJ-type ribon-helix-helix transcriptional regulator
MQAQAMADKKSEALFVRLEPHELAALDELVERYPAVSRSHVARVAMRLGLEQIQENPMLLLEAEEPKKASPKRRRKR